MGLFDSVFVACAGCGARAELQSKAGDCAMHEYDLSDVPPDVAGSLHGEEFRCTRCKVLNRIKIDVLVHVIHIPES